MTSKNQSTIASSENAGTITLIPDELLANATGPVTIPMTNDYLFRALLQRNNKVLKGLISSLLHLSITQIDSVKIQNPILLGKSVDEKDFILDIVVLMNNHTTINLEMQVIQEHNWTDRSLSYLCRSFDQLNTGDDYSKTKPVHQIGLLNFTLFPEAPEFYATYKMLNVKTHTIYNDKFILSVLNLTRKDLATEEDKQYHIDYWASLFQAKTWKEIQDLAAQNEYIKEAYETIYMLSREEDIREQCRAREDYYRRQRTMQHYIDTANAEKEAEKQRADQEQQRADQAELRADQEKQRADQEQQRADQEQQRADQEKHRADAAVAEVAALKAFVAELQADKAPASN